MRDKHSELTQKYSTWGDKLLQHTDVLYSIQNKKIFKPITVQIAPTESCSSGCPFCSVADRPLKSSMPFEMIKKAIKDFKDLGAKSLEITGGGEPLLYKDKKTGDDINSIINYAHNLGYEIGIITNSSDLKKIDTNIHNKINWIRISLIKLDEGTNPEEYNFRGYPKKKIGLSYIIYEDEKGTGTRKSKLYVPTNINTITKIAKVVELNPEVKFVRIAGNCLNTGNNALVRDRYKSLIDEIDTFKKIFIKDIGHDDNPFDDGCYVGLLRPYIAPNPNGNGEYHVYICSSHVLQKKNYDLDYSLCKVENILETWDQMNKSYQNKGYPYQVNNNLGCNWSSTCKFCFYKPNNKLIHTVANQMPDKNFA